MDAGTPVPLQAAIAALKEELATKKDDHDHSTGLAVGALVVGCLSMLLAVWAMYAIMQATTKLSCLNPDVALVRTTPARTPPLRMRRVWRFRVPSDPCGVGEGLHAMRTRALTA
jgi:hypothetical protein